MQRLTRNLVSDDGRGQDGNTVYSVTGSTARAFIHTAHSDVSEKSVVVLM